MNENIVTKIHSTEDQRISWFEACLNEDKVQNDFSIFLTVRMTDAVKNFNNVNPFKIAKWISTFGKDISVNKSRKDGSLTVNCKNSLACSKLMKCKTFMDENIVIVPHKFLNTTRGIFRCAELEDVQAGSYRDKHSPSFRFK